MKGYYYLHTNGDLIFKKFEPDWSDFVKTIWPIDTSDRADAWRVILESLALNARIERVKKLAIKWNCDLKDLVEYICRNINPSNLQQIGLRKYLNDIANVDHNEWFNWLENTPKGQEPDWETMPK